MYYKCKKFITKQTCHYVKTGYVAKAGRGAKYNLPKHLVVIIIVMCKCIITSILEKKNIVFLSLKS